MLPIRPRWLHFVIWIAMFPILIYELKLLYEINARRELEINHNTYSAIAKITETRTDSNGKPQIRYSFTVPNSITQYSATEFTDRTNLWITLTDESWQQARKSGTIKVNYLGSDPWMNDPVGKTDVLLSASIMIWCFLFLIDLVWFVELAFVGINFFKCARSLLKGEALRLHFWETMPEWNGILVKDPGDYFEQL